MLNITHEYCSRPRTNQVLTKDAKQFGRDYFHKFPYNDYKYSEKMSYKFRNAVEDAIGYQMVVDDKMLDVGCGQGAFVQYMEFRGVLAWGVDVSQWAVDNALTKNISVSEADNLSFFNNKYFDVVICRDVLYHLKPYNIRNALAEIHRVGSRCYVSTAVCDDESEIEAMKNWDGKNATLRSSNWWIKTAKAAGYDGALIFKHMEIDDDM